MAIDSRTPVPTTKGWIPAGKLQPGDEVFGYDGFPTKVTLVHEYDPIKCYKVILKDGLTIIGDGKMGLPVYAFWSLKDLQRWKRRSPCRRQIWPVGPVKLINHHIRKRAFLVMGKPIRPKEITLPVDPYSFGQWIMIPSQSKRNRKTEVTRNLIECYPTIPNLIPEEYLFASFEQRLALLRGIVSTRPKAFKMDRQRFEFKIKGIHLAKQVQNLAESLGIRVFNRLWDDKRGYFRIVFDSLLRLAEDQLPPKEPLDSEHRKIMRTIEVAPRKCVHIKVEAEHNTILVNEGYLPVCL